MTAPTPVRRSTFLRRFVAQRGALVASAYLLAIVGVGVLGSWLTPHDPLAQNLSAVLESPNGTHWLGTDDLGRDLLSRLIVATGPSVLAVLESLAVGVGLGVPLGLFAALAPKLVGGFVMRVFDGVMSFPPVLLAIAVISIFGTGLTQAMIAVGVVFLPRFARLTRTSVQQVYHETFIEASRVIGTPLRRIVTWHVIPNIVGPIVVQMAIASGFALLAEAGLSFLGLGVQPPDASWGSLLGRAQPYLAQAWWLAVVPGAVITLTVLATNVLADGIGASIGRKRERQP
jgi:peptide/nickel transport system permease protein